jgi:hypothetical protein
VSWSVLGGGVALLTLAWIQNISGPPPPNPGIAPMSSLIFFSLVVGWGYWLNRLRGKPEKTEATEFSHTEKRG